MNYVGIICEYNPFHNGHLYHLNKIKEMFPNDFIILVLSGNVTQRGELSILNKWEKTEIALQYGIDLVIELPYLYASQAADIFCFGALKILSLLGANKIVFGTETYNSDILKQCAYTQLKSNNYQKLVQKFLNDGINYPTALCKALEKETGYNFDKPNDLLGLGYVKEIIKNNYPIEPITILRTNNYHDTNFSGQISSATSIRTHIKEKKDLNDTVPSLVLKYIKDPIWLADFFPFIKYKIINEDNLDIYVSIDEKLANRMKKKIINTQTLEEFINSVKTKYYTYNRLMRACSHLLFSFTKEENNKLIDNFYIRVLGFNKKGQQYLNNIKKDINIPIITNYSNDKNNNLSLDLRITKVLSLIKGNNFLIEEITHKPIIKEKKI